MGHSAPPAQWKLLCGYLGPPESLAGAVEALEAELGPIDFVSKLFPFTYTKYYEAEMGAGISRAWMSFEYLVDPGCLAGVKLLTNRLETRFLRKDGGRSVNLDPGLLDESRLVLASTKDCPHRVYLGQGIYGEVTLLFHKGEYRALQWTYPDYAEHRHVFVEMRSRLRGKG